MKRVLYVDLSPSPGGSIISLYHLVTHLDPARFRPLVVLASVNSFQRFTGDQVPVQRVRIPRWERRSQGLVDRLRGSKVGAEMRRARWRARLWHGLGEVYRLQWEALPVARQLLRIMRQFQPHLVHLNTGVPLARPAAMAGRWLRIPTISHCRSFVLPTSLDNLLLLPGVRGLIFISQAVADAQLAAIPRPPRHRIIPNAVPVAEYVMAGDPATIRASLGVPPNGPLIGMVGRIAPWKGQHVFIEALALLSQRFPDVQGLIVGLAEEADGPGYADRIAQRARELGLSERLHMTGFRDDIPQVLSALDVVVHCSVRPEPFGRVIIEGMAAGRAVVGSRAGGALEIITHGQDGLLVSPEDPQALAAALADLLADPVRRARLGVAAQRTAVERYDIDAHVAAVQAFYDEVLADKAASSGL